jgi:serine/threonine-protein phosphatase 4 regulatory subunit 2
MDNIDAVVEELARLEAESAAASCAELPRLLEDYLIAVAKTGGTLVPWAKLKTLFRLKLENVIKEFVDFSPVDSVPRMPNVEPFRFDEMKKRIFEQAGRAIGVAGWVLMKFFCD